MKRNIFSNVATSIWCDWKKNTQQWFKNRRWNKEKMYWERTGCWRFSFYSTSSHDSFHSFFPPLTLSLARSCSTFIPNSMHENKISFNNFSFNHLPQLDCYTRKTKVLSFAVSHFLFFSHHHFPFLFFIIITRSLLFSCKYLKSLMSSFEFNLCMKFAWVTKNVVTNFIKIKNTKINLKWRKSC